jgi:hypothetical protein
MNYITVKENKLFLDHRIQISPLGRQFRYSGIKKDLKKPSKWINGMECWCWIYKFRYLDTDEFFGFYFTYENKFSHKI